jgi:Fe-S-cluster containining protein
VGQPDPLRELERQTERGNLFAHAVLSEQANRADENEAIVRGLVELLVQNRVVGADELRDAVNAVRTQTGVGIVIRVDGEGPEDDFTPVDCATRLPVCHAVCCRLRFPLTVEEVESGAMRWDLGRPYFNRHGEDGYCHQCDGETHACGVYESRPAPCREYSCAGDTRIWKDFDAMVLNDEWIAENLDAASPVEIFMAVGSRAPGA